MNTHQRFLDRLLGKYSSAEEVGDALEAMGWSEIGRGHFGAVYMSPNGDKVAKVANCDCAYADYIRLAEDHPDNPFFPKVFGWAHTDDGGLVALMELLEPVEDEDGNVDTLRQLVLDGSDGDDVNNADMAEFLGALRTLDAHRLDLDGDANFMVRTNGQLVVTDPLAA
ncbi:MAG: hypothetical protein GC134_06535 [Proteobacteria bacterium]|nr:hypothetical protein [Pseudomonadota bacterium]